MPEIAPYQAAAIAKLLPLLPPGTKDILEIGSDINCCVLETLADRLPCRIVGINPAADYPRRKPACRQGPDSRPHPLRADGCALPFPDASFDAILAIATLEHVIHVTELLSECWRVLPPAGIFYTDFGPIWSSAVGHHVYAVAGNKEARFWKPEKNPLPDYSHLLLTPDEMREFLRSGPCDNRLIEPIVAWVYWGKDINRFALEDYLKAFALSPLELVTHSLKSCKVQAARSCNNCTPSTETTAIFPPRPSRRSSAKSLP